MQAIIKDAEFRQQVKSVLEASEGISDSCDDVKEIINHVMENGIVDYAIDNRLKSEIALLNQYAIDIQNTLADSKKNVLAFIDKLDEIDGGLG